MFLVLRLILKFGVIIEVVVGGAKFIKTLFVRLFSKDKGKLIKEGDTQIHNFVASKLNEKTMEYMPVPEIVDEAHLDNEIVASKSPEIIEAYASAGDAYFRDLISSALNLDLNNVDVLETQVANLRAALARLNLTVDNCAEGVETIISNFSLTRDEAQKLRAQVSLLKSRLDALRTVLMIVKEDYIVLDVHGNGFSTLSAEALKRRKHIIQSVLKEEFFSQLGIGEEVPEIGLKLDVDFYPEGVFLTLHVRPESKVEFNVEGLGLYREVVQSLRALGFPTPELESNGPVYMGVLKAVNGVKVFISDLDKRKLIRLYYALTAWGRASLLLFS